MLYQYNRLFSQCAVVSYIGRQPVCSSLYDVLGKAESLTSSSNFDHLYLLKRHVEVLKCLYLEILVIFSFICISALQNLLEFVSFGSVQKTQV
jgi:hypothetical protein